MRPSGETSDLVIPGIFNVVAGGRIRGVDEPEFCRIGRLMLIVSNNGQWKPDQQKGSACSVEGIKHPRALQQADKHGKATHSRGLVGAVDGALVGATWSGVAVVSLDTSSWCIFELS